jgi:hypothetical protein
MSNWMAAIWAFLTNEANEKALALIGGFLLGLWTVVWGIITYIWPPKSAEAKAAETERQNERPDHGPVHKRKAPVTGFWSWTTIKGPAFKIWVIGMAVALGAYFGWRTYLDQPTITANFKVCRGEYENLCPPHDVFIGCSDPNVWATNECLKFFAVQLSVRDGNRCGYTVVNYTCSKKLPR